MLQVQLHRESLDTSLNTITALVVLCIYIHNTLHNTCIYIHNTCIYIHNTCIYIHNTCIYIHNTCIYILVVQLQGNGHANISCILSSVQSNTHIGQEVLIKRMTQNDSQFILVGWTTNWLTYRRGSARTGYPLGRLLYRTRAEPPIR